MSMYACMVRYLIGKQNNRHHDALMYTSLPVPCTYTTRGSPRTIASTYLAYAAGFAMTSESGSGRFTITSCASSDFSRMMRFSAAGPEASVTHEAAAGGAIVGVSTRGVYTRVSSFPAEKETVRLRRGGFFSSFSFSFSLRRAAETRASFSALARASAAFRRLSASRSSRVWRNGLGSAIMPSARRESYADFSAPSTGSARDCVISRFRASRFERIVSSAADRAPLCIRSLSSRKESSASRIAAPAVPPRRASFALRLLSSSSRTCRWCISWSLS
mmetsp:Transcript_7896/g.33025  ORF Transcript_7896/g.33025 Transcript_7896/m.33025 type:complete len:275 (-) Transcript_7896:531-1355(-)